MSIKTLLTETPEFSSLTAFVNGEVKVATPDNPNWTRLVEIARQPDNDDLESEMFRLFDPAAQVANFFVKLSDRVSVSGGTIYLDGDPINGALSDHIVRYTSNDDYGADPLVAFLEKVATNPDENSRDQLYAWLSKRNFTITDDGDFLAYKGVSMNYDENADQYPYQSIHAGPAIVDGVPVNGYVPNGVGAIVEMPRSQVANDPNVACHTGLHVGNFRYADSFGAVVLLVKVNPRDVVSVPHDSNSEKIRCCRYNVVDVAEGDIAEAYYDPFDSEEDSYPW